MSLALMTRRVAGVLDAKEEYDECWEGLRMAEKGLSELLAQIEAAESDQREALLLRLAGALECRSAPELEQVLESSAYLLLQDGHLAKCSERMAGQLGRSVEEVLGMSPSSFVHPDDLPYISQRIDSTLSTGHPNRPARQRFIQKDGSFRFVDVVSCRVRLNERPAVVAIVFEVPRHPSYAYAL